MSEKKCDCLDGDGIKIRCSEHSGEGFGYILTWPTDDTIVRLETMVPKDLKEHS